MKKPLIIALLTTQFFMSSVGIHAESKMPSPITDKGKGLFHIDAKVTNPDSYKKITGFELTVKLVSQGSIGDGTLLINTLMVSQGAQTADAFAMSYDGGVPRYTGTAKELITFSDFAGSSMFFTYASNATFSNGTVKVRYEGGKALFDDTNSILSAFGIYGQFDVTNVTWISGKIDVNNKTLGGEWPVSIRTKKYNDIPNVKNGTVSNYIDIEVPDGKGPYPVILWLHGGGWTQLNRKSCFISDTMDYLLSKGYAVVSAEYTLSQINGNSIKSGYPNMIYDLKAAVRYIRANAEKYNLDTSFVAAMGESAGGHLAMLLGTTNGNPDYEDLSMGNAKYSSNVQAIVSYFGPSNLTGMLALAALGSDYTPKQTEAASPYYKINKNTPPLFLTHGKNDAVVSIQQSYDMEKKAKSIIGEANVTSVYYDDAPHASVGAYDIRPAAEKVEVFLTKNLKKASASNQITVTKLSFPAKAKFTVKVGANIDVIPQITPDNANNYKLVWSSSNTAVAKVNQKGKVTGIKEGTAKIQIKDKVSNKTVSINVQVKKK